MPAETLSEKLSRLRREKRQKNVNAAEAARPQAQRYRTRTDLQDFVVKQLSVAREYALGRMKLYFFEFALDDNIMLVDSQDDAEEFFQPGSRRRPWTTFILRQFLEYTVDAKEGIYIPGSNGKIHHTSLSNDLFLLASLASRCQNPIEPAVLRSAFDWIDGRLVPQGRVNLVSRRKKMTMSQDVTLLLRALLTVEYMATHRHTRAILYIALFLNLAVDCSGRIGELLIIGGKLCEGKCLRWRDIEIYAFRLADGNITLKASVRYANLKGSSGQATKEQRAKVIPLRLMPLHLAAEDSLRLLVTLGMIDDVFEHIQSWQDIQYLNPGPHGSQVAIRKTSLPLPVFRQVSKSLVVTNDSLRRYNMTRWLAGLGRHLGLTSSLLSYCLRRGAAYLLAMNCTEEERCARMGHKSGDAVYWTHYRNEISAIDFQAIRANVDAEDVSILSSIALASRPGAPTSLSPEGFRTVYENPELKTLLLRESDLLDSLLSKHLTLDIARTEAPWEMQRLEELQQQILRVKFRLRTQTYREEYQAFVEAPCEITRPPEKGPDDAGLGTTVVDDCASAKLREHDHEMICLPLRRSPSDTTSLPLEDGGSVDDYDGKFTNIDPTLLEEDAQQHVEDYLAEGQADIGDDHANDDFCDDEHSDEDHVILTQKRVSQTGKAKTLISPWHLGGDISAAMFSEDSEMEIPLGNKMVDFFNHLHPIDSFFPGQEPLPGTLACRFCNETMILQHAVGHARACAKKLALRQCISVLETHFTVLEQCSWVNRLGKRCGKTGFKSHVDVANHIGSHYNCYKDANGLKANICQLSPCNEATTPVIYGAPAAWVQHLITVHRIPGAQSKTGDAYIHWCGLCGRWLCQLVEDLDDHVSNHEEMIGDLIRTEGFTGARVGRTTIRPPLNPFQLFDISLRPSARFHLGYNNTNDVNVHIADYVENLDDDVRLACPASADAGEHIRAVCYETAPMRKEELCLHMEKAHGLKPRVRPDKKKKRALHADVDKASKVEKGKATADKKKKRMLQADDDEASKAKKGKATADEKKKRMLQADDDEASKAKKGKATADEKKRVLQADDDESSKVKKGKPSRSMPTLAPRSINANIGAAMRSNASAYLTKH